MFSNLNFSISLSSRDSKTKKELIEEINSNGGQIGFGISRHTTHFITSEKDIIDTSFNVKSAYKSGCWVVTPSFIFDSTRAGKKDSEWNHTFVGKKPAPDHAEDEEEFLLRSFKIAVPNVTNIRLATGFPEDIFSKALHTITSLSVALISKYDQLDNYSGFTIPQLVDSAIELLPDETQRAHLVEQEQQESQARPSFSSSYTTSRGSSQITTKRTVSRLYEKKPAFFNPLLKEGQGGFLEVAAKRQKEREEKQQQLAEAKRLKEEERRKKEEAKARIEAEKRRKYEEQKRQEQEARAKLEEERRKRKEEEELKARQLTEMLGQGIDYLGLRQEEEDERMEREAREKEEAELHAKQESKKAKKSRQKESREQFLSEKSAVRSERKQKRVEETQKLAEEAEKLAAEKERRRQAYTARQDKKRMRVLLGEDVQARPAPPQDDDRKLFIGGITFKDLDKYQPNELPADTTRIKYERIKHLFRLFERYGTIEKKKDSVIAKRHGFVVYENKDSCERAFKALSNFEERQRLTKEVKDSLIQDGAKKDGVYAPTAHFYVRRVHAVVKGRKSVFND